ncbi:MAG: glycosyltransferase [candidate division WOR-3 bacterium]
MIESFLFALYLLLLLFLSLYATHGYIILYYYLTRNRKNKKKKFPPPLNYFPFVTIQLPIYNEKYVVARLLSSVTNLDYPKERYEIQILDDSTDETTFILASLVEEYKGLGYNISLHHRSQRIGFKAGALREGLLSARGEFIAIFDADFIVPPDFLKMTIPYFFLDEKIAAVQTRWGHLNRDYSILTQGQALALDAHFLFEQDIKSQVDLFINFNGTCGVWRKEAILAAGNWQDDTLTEDLDLSYRAQLKGYKILFLPEIVCPGELPIDIQGFKKQQFRWTKGGVEVAKKILGEVLRAKLPRRVKFFSFTHLTSPLVYPILFFLSLLSFPIVATKIKYTEIVLNPLYHYGSYWAVYLSSQARVVNLYYLSLSLFTIFVLPYPITYILSYRRVQKLDGNKEKGRKSWFLVAFLLIGGFVSLSLINTQACLQALWGKKSEFTRTPKFSVVGKKGSLRDKKYLSPISKITFLEMGMGFYLLFTLIYALSHWELALAPFLLLYTLGFLFLSFSALSQHWEFKKSMKKELETVQPVGEGEVKR